MKPREGLVVPTGVDPVTFRFSVEDENEVELGYEIRSQDAVRLQGGLLQMSNVGWILGLGVVMVR